MDKETLEALEKAAEVASGAAVAAAPSGAGGIIAAVTALVLKAASAAAGAGLDPVAHIRRILEADPVLAPIRAEFDRVIRESFPQSEPPPAAPTSTEAEADDNPYAWPR